MQLVKQGTIDCSSMSVIMAAYAALFLCFTVVSSARAASDSVLIAQQANRRSLQQFGTLLRVANEWFTFSLSCACRFRQLWLRLERLQRVGRLLLIFDHLQPRHVLTHKHGGISLAPLPLAFCCLMQV